MSHREKSLDKPVVNLPPPHCPYQPGDWVRVHGIWNPHSPSRRWGWRGFVLGHIGATILTGLTDDGFEWAEEWGALEPDRPRPRGVFDVCTCCPRVAIDDQPALFQVATGPSPVRRGDLVWWRQQYGLPTADLFGADP